MFNPETLEILRKALFNEECRLDALGYTKEADTLYGAWIACRSALSRADRLEAEFEEVSREFTILEGACDFWKQEALDRGYDQGDECP
jgi:hypothetical protein